jgi:biopolymer transport protein TolQ
MHADHPMAEVFRAAMIEWGRTHQSVGDVTPSTQERIDRVMSNTISKELTRMERYMNFLATVGSVAPFVGLFGTVWGIMNSFQAIAVSRDTNLAVVAPGIAEALFATALGLLAAIPAVMAYNKFSTDINRFGIRLEGFTDDLSGILSRQVDQGDF